MKCAAMRLAEEFRDVDDVRYLLRYLNVTTADHALEIVTQYFDEDRLMPNTRLALEELLDRGCTARQRHPRTEGRAHSAGDRPERGLTFPLDSYRSPRHSPLDSDRNGVGSWRHGSRRTFFEGRSTCSC